jgi:protein-S-isoprenylcysteine O-methyltransferase Ste14
MELEQKRTSNKAILGYVVGGLLVLILFPSLIYLFSNFLDGLYIVKMTHNQFTKLAIVVPLLLVGFIFSIWSIIAQHRIGKGGPTEVANIEISPKTRNLVVTGPYKYTRNPMLFGTFLAYLALAVFINSLNSLFLVIIFVVCMLLVIKKSEEKRLSKDFGSRYEEYRRKTSMIVPWFPRKP